MISARNDASVDGAFTEMAMLGQQVAETAASKLNEEERATLVEYLAVCRMRAEDAVRRADQHAVRAKRLAEVADGLESAQTPGDVVRVIVEVGVPTVGASGGGVMLLSPDGQHLELAGAVGYAADQLDRYRSFSIDARLPSAAAARERLPVYVRSLDEWIERFDLDEVAGARAQRASWACVPLIAERRLLGVLSFTVQRAGAFDDDDQVFIASLACECALALSRGRASEEAALAQHAKSDFLAMVSHELRTPLGAIIGYADLLRDGVRGQVNDDQADLLGRIRACGLRLADMVSDMINLASLESHALPLMPAACDVCEIVKGVASLAEPLARQKRLRFVRSLPDGRITMVTDGSKVRQIALKLLSNAVKFTDAGEVGVGLEMTASSVCVRVWDTGVGIEPGHAEKIFEGFWQAERGFVRRTTGPGLGLAVARRLAHLLGGDIDVLPNSPRGTQMRFSLPRD